MNQTCTVASTSNDPRKLAATLAASHARSADGTLAPRAQAGPASSPLRVELRVTPIVGGGDASGSATSTLLAIECTAAAAGVEREPLRWTVLRRFADACALHDELFDGGDGLHSDIIAASEHLFPTRSASADGICALLPSWLAAISETTIESPVFAAFLDLMMLDRALEAADARIGSCPGPRPAVRFVVPAKLPALAPSASPQHPMIEKASSYEHARVEVASARASVELHVPRLTVSPDAIVLPVSRALAASKVASAAAKAARAAAEALKALAAERATAAATASAVVAAVEAEAAAVPPGSDSKRGRELAELRIEERRRLSLATAAAADAHAKSAVASQLEADSAAKLRGAKAMHQAASRQLLGAEHAVAEGALHEEHLHVIEGCAAAARAKHAVQLAAHHKAEEEAALTQLASVLVDELAAQADVDAARTRVRTSKQSAEELKGKACTHQAASASATRAAAQASAEQDAHSHAAAFAFEQSRVANVTERELREMVDVDSAINTSNGGAGSDAVAIDGGIAALEAIHEGVAVSTRHLEGVGRALTTPGPDAARRVADVGIKANM